MNKPRCPRVSWLVCTHCEDKLLHRAVCSCLNQTMQDFELLLVVNGPNVEALLPQLTQVYAKDQRVRVIGTPVHLLNFSLSLGLHLARAPFVARMDADDISHPERLAKQLAFMEAHDDVVVLGTSYHLVDAHGTIHGQIRLPESDKEIRKSLRFRNPFCHPAVMLRRAAVLAVGAYLGGKNAEDYDLWLRLAMNSSWRFANLSEPLLSYNISPGGGARRSREAYANVASAQFRQFLISRKIHWLIGVMASSAKSFLLADRP